MLNKCVVGCITVFILFAGCGREDTYADVRAYINEMEAYLNQYGQTMSRARNAGEVARAIDQYRVKMMEFARRSGKLVEKYPELAGDQVPAELQGDFERLNETANALSGRIAEILEKYMSDPAVLNAILNRADNQEEIIGMGMGK